MKDIKVANPEECDSIVKELKKGKIKKGELAAMFGADADYNLDVLARHGLLTRTYVEENGKHMIQLEFSGKQVKFKQGQKDYPKRNRV